MCLERKKRRDYSLRPASERQAVKIKPFWCRGRPPREWKDRCVQLSSRRSAPSRLILSKPSTTVADGHLSDRETTLTWNTKRTWKRGDEEGFGLEEQPSNPEPTLLQTWGHLNICLQHVHREFNQSQSEINIRPNSPAIGGGAAHYGVCQRTHTLRLYLFRALLLSSISVCSDFRFSVWDELEQEAFFSSSKQGSDSLEGITSRPPVSCRHSPFAGDGSIYSRSF